MDLLSIIIYFHHNSPNIIQPYFSLYSEAKNLHTDGHEFFPRHKLLEQLDGCMSSPPGYVNMGRFRAWCQPCLGSCLFSVTSTHENTPSLAVTHRPPLVSFPRRYFTVVKQFNLEKTATLY